MKRGRNGGSEEGGHDAVLLRDHHGKKDRRPPPRTASGAPTTTAVGEDVFAAARDMDAQDSREDAKRRRRGHRLAGQARAAQSQAALYGSLVEGRIVLQPSLVGIQKWRQQQRQHQLLVRDAKDESRPSASASHCEEIVKHCDELLTLLLEGRRTLNRRKAREGDDDRGLDHDDDGDSDDEDEDEDVDYASVLLRSSSRGGADEADVPRLLETVLQSEYDEMRESWKEILNRRHKDVKLRSGQTTSKTQFKVVDSSLWQQVEATADHEHQHHQLRQNASASTSTANSQALDDSKMYQQLLKDFLSSHHGASASSAAAAAQDRLRRRGAQHQQRSSSSAAATSHKAPVDRKASKGRKIRYHDLPKLQHFAFPVSRGVGCTNASATTLMDEDEWFRSLFGGVGRNAKG